ncbi:MAG: 30S ribosomal protein S20 [Prevotellaceae bacterium]|nr:30S ribosomal protein S20 [Candidatus Colivivens equi]MCQ2076617.1 30S ribosomal protein S20 [Bacteroidaceae bacterium]
MANHKSTLKRIRQNAKRKEHNHYYAKTMRNALRDFRKAGEAEAKEMLPKLQKMLDKLAKKNVIHKNKAANLKSGAALHLAKLA